MADFDPLGSNLIFVFSPPRAGSTMLQFMLEAHSLVRGAPEPYFLVPLKYSGYFGTAKTATYDVVNASLATREFVNRLPRKEDDYLDACRAYASTLYSRTLDARAAGAVPAPRYFVDKTPANVLEWPFVTRLFPRAKFVVLLRHPLAVLHSIAETFFLGDYARTAAENQMLADYYPAIAAFLRSDVPRHVLTYEKVVADPETHVRELTAFLDLPYEDSVVNYGDKDHAAGSMGDPTNARKSTRPVGSSAHKWAQVLKADPQKLQIARQLVARVPSEDLATTGYPAASLFDPLEGATANAHATRNSAGFAYRFQRRVFFGLRSLARFKPVRACFERINYYTSVILRD